MLARKLLDFLNRTIWHAPSAAVRRGTIAIYAMATFLSALLIFAVQPMFTKIVLPKLGGSPSVWSVAMVVFQAALFIGYIYAHLLVRIFTPRRAAVVHLAFLVFVAATLPLGIAKAFGLPPERGVTLWLAGLFFVSIGPPFVALAASAPLLQSWFSTTRHKRAVNPYILYGVSNLGSFAALLAYPFLIEPSLSLQTQISLWSAGYYVLITFVAAAACFAAGHASDIPRQETESEARPSAGQRFSWIVLAAIPSALVIAVTAYISTDLASIPLLWVPPLALYLLTFVAVFRDRPWIEQRTVLRLIPYGVTPLALSAIGGNFSGFISIALNLFIFVLIALGCHGEAYRIRPHRSQLTEFYLWISFGGALGGMFAGVVAPNVFNNTYEYPILLMLALLILPAMSEGGWERFVREAGPGLMAAAILAAVGIAYEIRRLFAIELTERAFAALVIAPLVLLLFFTRYRLVRYFRLIALTLFGLLLFQLWRPADGPITTVRSFFGVNRVIETRDRKYHALYHGTTLHGAMRVRDSAGKSVVGRPELLTYYYFGGPLSDTIEATRGANGTLNNVAVLGLGAGSLACHRREGERWTFFEIDPEVVRIARDPTLFRFLSACAPSEPIVLGDARLTLAARPAQYDLIVLDVFSSDAIPVHLLTREAFADYLSHLAPHGVIAAHLSNRYMELVSVVGAVGTADGLISYVKYEHASLDFVNTYRERSVVVALARERDHLGDLPSRAGWQPVDDRGVTAWTDDYSNVFGAIVRKVFGQ